MKNFFQIRHFLKKLSGIKLKNKLLISYLLLIIMPFGIFAIMSNFRVYNAIETLVSYSAKHSFEQSGLFVSYKIDKIINTIDVLLVDKKINSTISQEPDKLDIPSQMLDMQDLSRYLRSFQNQDEVFNVKLYVKDDFLYSSEKVNFLSFQDAKNSDWYEDFVKYHKKVIWVKTTEQDYTTKPDDSEIKRVSAVSAILDKSNYLNFLGFVRIDILEKNLSDILKKASSTKNSVTYIQNSKNEIISSSSEKINNNWIFDSNELENYSKNGMYYGTRDLGKEHVILACQKLPNSDWTLVSITPFSEITAVGKELQNQMLLMFLLISTAAYILAYVISSSITKNISLLLKNIRLLKKGDFNIEITTKSNDEIGELIENFNSMSARLKFLVDEQYRIGLEAKNAELLALQAQINPHFLYNTLDMINWSAINNNVPEISDTVQTLSRFYKLSLSKGSNIIPIRNEIEHVKMYMEIQNMRFENIFDFQVHIDEEVYQYTTIKIILQPIVENSVLHGILQKDDRSGLILITGHVSEGVITLKVQDNGIGIKPEKLKTILTHESNTSGTHGYGVRNINERIKLFYGEQYGLEYNSVPGKGTTVIIRIPAGIPVQTQ
ncbi:sensor histidine kinase [Ruminiclostridium cellobioparum]|uniref:Integral membrane sensor signal transduction histidine kinase n=1 Tax=Ruminiclostridium cellobioparum subsp. termitidis CT1112 TaxID=1195236 RepID=S0FF76_RUMCE|nr:sensor histidine kinase [Ruminiclostridium cellobioparum]EMS69375.1 integral membrane sensor signal transduction histidine kinase [Ruminiclostridium cellobioparum subsp. termitidis CT1112]